MRGHLIESVAFDNDSDQSLSSERNGVWDVSGNTSGWSDCKGVADSMKKDIPMRAKRPQDPHPTPGTWRKDTRGTDFSVISQLRFFFCVTNQKGWIKRKEAAKQTNPPFFGRPGSRKIAAAQKRHEYSRISPFLPPKGRNS